MKVGDRVFTYIFEDYDAFSKINLLQGDTGTGKTCLAELCSLLEEGIAGTYTTKEFKIHTVTDNKAVKCNADIQEWSDTLVILDEDSPFLSQKGEVIQSVIHSTSNKFLIISRDKKLNFLSIPIEAIWIVHNSGKYNYIKRRYTKIPNLNLPTEVDDVLLEDRKSSYFLFRDYFSGVNIISAKGKDNVCSTLKQVLSESGTQNILVAVDSCAFGLAYEEIKHILDLNKNVKLLTWKCYEEYILRSPNFAKINLKKDMQESDYDVLLSSLITYNKEKVSKCITSKNRCSECKDFSNCNYKVHVPRRDNYIHDELAYIMLKSNTNNEVGGFPT